MDRADLASAKHRNGFNCCQSVACVFADEVEIDESLLYKMGEGFGAGMGTTQGVCGALSGAAMLAGLKSDVNSCAHDVPLLSTFHRCKSNLRHERARAYSPCSSIPSYTEFFAIQAISCMQCACKHIGRRVSPPAWCALAESNAARFPISHFPVHKRNEPAIFPLKPIKPHDIMAVQTFSNSC